MSKPIPISAAEQVAIACGIEQVIIIGWARDDKRTHVTTYGVTALRRKTRFTRRAPVTW